MLRDTKYPIGQNTPTPCLSGMTDYLDGIVFRISLSPGSPKLAL